MIAYEITYITKLNENSIAYQNRIVIYNENITHALDAVNIILSNNYSEEVVIDILSITKK